MKRTNTAKWEDKYKRWKINVQKEGIRKSFYSSTPGRNGQREANKKADAWLDDDIVDQTVKVSKLYQEFLEDVKINGSKSNYVKLEGLGRNWIVPTIGNKRIANLTEHDIQTVISKAYSKTMKSKKSLMNLRGAMTKFIRYCRKRKVTKLIPIDIEIPKNARVEEKRILQPDGLQKLFSCDTVLMRGKRVYDEFVNAYRFEVLTGLRPGEVIGLEWEDIRENTAYIRRSVNVYKEVTQGKNQNAVRHFVLTPQALDVLESQRKQHPDAEGSIFNIKSLSSYSKRWKRFCESNDIDYVALYEMRHTFVSIAKNLTEGQVKTIVGHSKNMDTFGIYGHEVDGELEETAGKLSELFNDVLKTKDD